MSRVYLDWNATTPLRPEAREAMLQAMDVLGNPSSVHAEGRAAKGLIERARAQVARATGADGADIVFTSSATEAANLALRGRDFSSAAIEHDCVFALRAPSLAVGHSGLVDAGGETGATLQAANSETGICQKLQDGLEFIDAVQAVGKIPFGFLWTRARSAAVSAHKLGGPKGVGALLLNREALASGGDIVPLIAGGGQEMGRRSGTENVIGIAGFGAAAEAAERELETGIWNQIKTLRNLLEERLATAAPDTIFFGQEVERLPNTACFAVPGWKGETQVMQMDLAGFAVSAGSACSSGKVRPSRVLQAMGYDALTAASAIRVSMGSTTTEVEVMAFADVWIEHYRRWKNRAA